MAEGGALTGATDPDDVVRARRPADGPLPGSGSADRVPLAPERTINRLRKICLALPETHEELTWGEHPNFRVRNKIFVIVGADTDQITFKADPEERAVLLQDEARFFYPPYVGSKGWLGMYLKGKIDWTEVTELLTTSYCLIAPKKLAASVSPA